MICLTFDTDHMDEMRMGHFLDSVDIPGTGTFFCTQKYTSLEQSRHETGPHPFLEEGADWKIELQKMRDMFPAAKGWRSHSCVFSHILAEWLGENGYSYASTNDQFGQRGIQPIRQPWGISHFPIYYMDNMDFSCGHFWDGEVEKPFAASFISNALEDDGVYVFDFHPIHLLLNTPSREYYFSMRDKFKSGADIDDLTFKGFGTLTFFESLCAQMHSQKKQSLSLDQALMLQSKGV